MAMNVGSLRFTVGQRPNKAPPQTFSAIEPTTEVLLPEEIDGDEYSFVISPRTRVIRITGVRRARFAMRPRLVFADPDGPGPPSLLIELPDLQEALALVVDGTAMHAPQLELVGLLVATRSYLRQMAFGALSYLHQAHVVAPMLETLELGTGHALLSICAPATATLSVPADLQTLMTDQEVSGARVNVWQAKPPGARLGLLEVMHWFTPRAYRDDEATYDADNLVFELGPDDDIMKMGQRALTLRLGRAGRPHQASVKVLPDNTNMRWLVVPRNVILAQEPSEAPLSSGGGFERTVDPSPNAAVSWAEQVGSLQRLLEAPSAQQTAATASPPPLASSSPPLPTTVPAAQVTVRVDFARTGARPLLDRLANEERDFSERDYSDVDPVRDAPEAVARLRLMREKPLAAWTWRELAEWKGVRHQRLRALLSARGLAPEPRGVRRAEVVCEEHLLKGALRNQQLFHGTPEPRIEHIMRRGSIAGWNNQVPDDVVERERGELLARSLFAIEAWCASNFDNATIAEVRDAWRARWLTVDDALGPEGIARCGELAPHFAPVADDVLARAAATMEEEARPPPPPPPDRSVTVVATTPVATFHNTVDQRIDTQDADLPRIEIEVARLTAPDTFEASTATFLGEVEFGRVVGADVQLSGSGVARRHATLVTRDSKLIMVDRRSVTGTYVDGRRLSSPKVLEPTSVITIGGYRIRVRLLPPSVE